ncbi:MAG: CbiX/SirB N-terminal domain-containing protein [Candidatus Hydrogenedentes bacterium]|nr:CbiX/SirB N-terminal domain-containing protein [Candidatus Hydrogenedentota bacterium]
MLLKKKWKVPLAGRVLAEVAMVVAGVCLAAHLTSGHVSAAGEGNEKVSVVVVGHGGVPKDYPRLKELFDLHDKGGEEFEKLEHEVTYWPRTQENDAYWAGFMRVVESMRQKGTFHSVHAAFNEMCAPTIPEALAEARESNPDTIVVVTTMLTPGGGHSEKDIPAAVEDFKKTNPDVKVVYAWPFDVGDVSSLLAEQAVKFAADYQETIR